MHVFDEDAAALARARESGPEQDGATRSGPVDAPSAQGPQDAASLLRLQRSVGNAGVVQMMQGEDDPHGLQNLVGKGGGSPLDAGTRVQMESAIGADFSSVRVHTGGEADQSAKSLGAHAYTAGNDVVFAEGKYDPGSAAGQRTLAHELTHVVQQRSGPVDGTMTDTGVKVSDPSDRFEQAAEANADRVMSTQSLAAGPAPAAADLAAVGVQREEAPEEEEPVQTLVAQREVAQREVTQREEATAAPEEEEEPVQGMFVQREGESDEEEMPG